MRVAQMIDRVHWSGGAERLQQTFAESLDPSAVSLTVITLRDSLPESEAALRDRGVRIARFPARSFADPQRARELLRYIRAERFDLLHAHLVRSTVLAGLAGRSTGTPVVATLHNTKRDGGVGLALGAAERWALRRADRVIAVGWETARVHRRALGARDIEVIPNAVATPDPLGWRERIAVRRELGVPDGAPLLIAVGRLVPQKAPLDLVRAFAQVHTRGPAPALWIVGRGRLEGRLAREIRRLGIGDRVRMLGLRSDVPRLLGASDLYVSASLWEGLPVAMLEAMAVGLPVVATRVGDVPRALDGDSGVLLSPRDPAAVARAVAGLLADPARCQQLGARGRERVRAHFGTQAWAERHLALYAEVARRAPGSQGAAQWEETRCAS
jgi:glycosyltransferase involved in cell wall biosynthesis